MKGSTHMLAGISSALVYSHLMAEPSWQIILGGILGSLLPDIDHPKSTVALKLKLYLFIRHRGFTHSLTALLLFILIAPWAEAVLHHDLYRGIIIGIISHIFLDTLTPAGVQLFFPCKKRFSLPLLAIIHKLLKTVLGFILLIYVIYYLCK